MQDSHQPETYGDGDGYYYEPEPKKGMSGWLIALIVVFVLIIVCCLCACLATLLMGPTIGNTFSTVIEGLPTPVPIP